MKHFPRVTSLFLGGVFAAGLCACGDGCAKKAEPPSAPAAAARPEVAAPAPTPQQAELSKELPKAAGARLYVSNEDSGDVSVIDLATQREVARVPVGKRPRAIKLSADRRLLFVALSGSPKQGPDSPASKDLPPPDPASDTIVVLDLAEGRVLRRLPAGEDPEQFDLSADGKHVYMSNEEDARVSIIDVESGKIVGSVKVTGEPEGIGVDPGGKLAYVTSETENSVDVVDMIKRTRITKAKAGLRPRSVLVSPDGARVFISNELGASVTMLDGVKHGVLANIEISSPGARPMGLALSRDGAKLFVSTGRGKSVAEVDVATAQVTRSFDAGGTRPWGIVVSPDGKTLYTANGPSNDVSAIDIETGTVTRRIAVGESPWGVVLAEQPPAASDAAVEAR